MVIRNIVGSLTDMSLTQVYLGREEPSKGPSEVRCTRASQPQQAPHCLQLHLQPHRSQDKEGGVA